MSRAERGIDSDSSAIDVGLEDEDREDFELDFDDSENDMISL
jgi:hypothetical protein